MSAVDLLPCPFCGERAHIVSERDINTDGRLYFVKCRKCRAKGPESYANETCPIFYEGVRATWNTRAPVSVGKVKALEWKRGVVDLAKPMPGMKYVACSTTPAGSWAFWLDEAPETRAVFPSEAEAKSAAQADYDARILAALEGDGA